MDFFAGRLQAASGSGLQLVLGGGNGRSTAERACTLPLPEALAAPLRSQAGGDGRAVVVGIRPEDFTQVGADGSEETTLQGPVEVVEYLGNEQLIYVRLPGTVVPEAVKAAQEAAAPAAGSEQADGAGGGSSRAAEAATATTARLPASPRIEVGTQVRLGVDPAKLHLFDPETTKRLA